MKKKNIILAVSQGELRDELLLYFGHSGAKVYVTLHEEVLMQHLKTKTIGCIVTQMKLNAVDAVELILKVRDINTDVPIILIDGTEDNNKDIVAHLNVAAYFKHPLSALDIYRQAEHVLKTGDASKARSARMPLINS